MEQENVVLKNTINELQQQLNHCRNTIRELNRQIQSISPTTKRQATEKSDSQENDKTDVKTALLAQFSKSKSISSPNVLEHATKDTNQKATFAKYNLMLKVGVDLSGVITQMNNDHMEPHLIDQFKTSHNIDLNAPKFAKYNRMKKLKMPIKTITNKMKLDGLTQAEIDVFSGKDPSSKPTNVIDIAKQLGLPPKPTIPKPVNQMKRVHWKPVTLDKIKSSIWHHINHKWFDYDPITFELNFQTRKRKYKMKTDALKSNVGTQCDEKQIQNQPHINQFVDAKRSQMVQIALRSFNITNEDLRDVILSLNEVKLDINHLIALIDIVPTPEEQIQAEKASEHREIKHFGVVERFFYCVYDVVELKERLQKWLFKRQFEDKCNRLKEQINAIEQAKKVIINSHNLREILSVILAFGNHCNYGNAKGNAYGFQLDVISLLPQIKTTDNSMTFPMFIWAFIKKKYPQLMHILEEFKPVQVASHIAIDIVQKEFDTLQNEMQDLSAMIVRYQEEYVELIHVEDMFLNDMSAFVVLTEKDMTHLKQRMNDMRTFEKQLIDFFAYTNDDKTVCLSTIFKDVDALIEMLSISKVKCKQLEKENKKREMRQQRKLRRKVKRANTEHLTRNRFQTLLNKSKEKPKKHRKHRHRRHSKHKLRDHGEDGQDEPDHSVESDLLSLQDAMSKEGKSKSRESRHFDRTKHSSFELFRKVHSEKKKKKNIRFKMDIEEKQSQSHDNMHANVEAEMDDEDDMELPSAAPGFFQSKSVQGLHALESPIAIIYEDNDSPSNSESQDLILPVGNNALTLSLSEDLVQLRTRRHSDPGTPILDVINDIKMEIINDTEVSQVDDHLVDKALVPSVRVDKMNEDHAVHIDRTSNIRVSINRSRSASGSDAKNLKRKKKKKKKNTKHAMWGRTHSQSYSYSESVVEHQYHRNMMNTKWILNKSQSEKRFVIDDDEEEEEEEEEEDDNVDGQEEELEQIDNHEDAADPEIEDDEEE
eukprot:1019630_1